MEYSYCSEDQDWLTEQWNADETPYRIVRQSIDRLAKVHALNTELVATFEKDWLSHRSNSIALFKWTYAANEVYAAQARAAAFSWHGETLPRAYGEITVAYQNFPLTHSFEFDRAHFIYDVETGAFAREYTPMAQRLYDHDKDDPTVAHMLAVMLTTSSKASDIYLAADVADHLLKIDADNPRNYVVWGWTHYLRWGRSHDISDLKKGVRGYEHYLSSAEATEDDKRWYGTLLKRMKRQLVKAEQHKR